MIVHRPKHRNIHDSRLDRQATGHQVRTTSQHAPATFSRRYADLAEQRHLTHQCAQDGLPPRLGIRTLQRRALVAKQFTAGAISGSWRFLSDAVAHLPPGARCSVELAGLGRWWGEARSVTIFCCHSHGERSPGQPPRARHLNPRPHRGAPRLQGVPPTSPTRTSVGAEPATQGRLAARGGMGLNGAAVSRPGRPGTAQPVQRPVPSQWQ